MRSNDDGLRDVIVYSDCKGVVEACNGGIRKRRMFGWKHGEYVFYEERLKICDKCKVPVNVCICESVFAKRSYDSRNLTEERKD